METYSASTKPTKPPLEIDDLQYDYDRTQIRDPRTTPGRESRPYYQKTDDIPVALLEKLQATRSEYKTERPKGRLTNVMKNDMFVAEAQHNPWECFNALYRCFDKGREGSPTYDASGFLLDYDKVCRWMKPEAYSRLKMLKGVEKQMEEAEKEREGMFTFFFADELEDVKEKGISSVGSGE